MDVASAFIAILAAGAAAGLKETASDAVKSAYAGLKAILAGKLSSLANLEEHPDDPDYQSAAKKEISHKGLIGDGKLVDKARELIEAIEREAPHQNQADGINLSEIRAARDVLIRNLEATGAIAVRDVASNTGNIHIEGIRAGSSAKN